MNLKGIVSVSGKPGLWKALVQNKTGFVLESLDANKTKLVANLTTAKIAALDEITIFGTDEDIRLLDVFARMKEADNIPDAKSDGKQLRRFFREVAPDHDEEKVYASDMKKVISWFNILKDMPIFVEDDNISTADPSTEQDSPAAENVEPVTSEEAEETASDTVTAEADQEEADDAPQANADGNAPPAAKKKRKR
jgi:hypothetical protein